MILKSFSGMSTRNGLRKIIASTKSGLKNEEVVLNRIRSSCVIGRRGSFDGATELQALLLYLADPPTMLFLALAEVTLPDSLFRIRSHAT